MRKFAFSLQTVYDLTISTEKQQKIRIKQLEGQLRQLRAELEAMKEAYLDSKERFAEDMKKGLSSEKLSQYNIYFESLINSMIAQKDKILRTEQELERWMQKRIVTRREIKTYEKLRETQYEEYLVEERREAEKDIGDLVSFRVAAR